MNPGYHSGGLYLQVTEAGSKSWIFRFARAGKRREVGLGPEALVASLLSRYPVERAAPRGPHLARQSGADGDCGVPYNRHRHISVRLELLRQFN
jgi:hypothetical protein